MNRSLSRNRPASSRASRMAPLPFWRETTTPTSKAAHLPSGRSPRALARTNSCHGSRTRPANRASSTASAPAEPTEGGKEANLGRCAPSESGGASSSKLIEAIHLVLGRRKLPQPVQGLQQGTSAHGLGGCRGLAVEFPSQRPSGSGQGRVGDLGASLGQPG